MERRYSYITDEMLTEMDNERLSQFGRQYILIHKFGLTKTQADRVIVYHRALRQVEALMRAGK